MPVLNSPIPSLISSIFPFLDKYLVKGIKKVRGVLGTKGIPVPVSDKEIEKILGQIKDGEAQPK